MYIHHMIYIAGHYRCSRITVPIGPDSGPTFFGLQRQNLGNSNNLKKIQLHSNISMHAAQLQLQFLIYTITGFAGSFRSASEDVRSANKLTTASLEQLFRDLFLPKGYPQSVSDDYLEYQLWDTLQAFASSINGL